MVPATLEYIIMKNDYKASSVSSGFSCGLPAKLGWFRHLWLKMLFEGICNNKDQFNVLHSLPNDAIIIYVNKNKSKFEWLLFYFQCNRNKFPTPRVTFDYRFCFLQSTKNLIKIGRHKILNLYHRRPLPDPYTSGYLRKKLLECNVGFLSLMGMNRFLEQWTGSAADPLQYLLHLQSQINRPIFLVPQLIFFDKRPFEEDQSLTDIFFGSRHMPGRMRRLITLIQRPENIFIEISEPINLDAYLKRMASKNLKTEELATDLKGRLLKQINGHRQRITGPVLKSGEELRQAVLTAPNLSRYIERHAVRKKISLQEARKEAAKYFDEIAAKYSRNFVSLGAAMMRWLLKNLFDDVNVDMDALNRIKRRHLKGPLVFIPCHKSNLDNMTLMSILHANHVHCPHTFAGENLSFWPVGPFIRRTGAFFMRRSFKGAVFYAMVFSEYIKTLLRESYNLEVFIEGTRSRTGKLLRPQIGGLSILINACQNGACPDLVFVPVSISYDRIPEEGSYLNEIQGGQKTKESLWGMIKGGKILRSRYGSIYFRFAEPIVLSNFMEQENLDISETLKGKRLNLFCQKLGQQLLYDIQCISIISPQSIAAAALLSISRQNITSSQVFEIVNTYLSYLSNKKVLMTDALIVNPEAAVKNALEYFVHRRIIEPIQGIGPQNRYNIPINKRNTLEFYKNNMIGHLVPAAFTALLVLAADVFQFSSNHLHQGYAFLQDVFANEFIFDPDQSATYQIRKTIKIFIDDSILVPHPKLPDTYNLTSPGYRKLQQFSGLLKSLFEAYSVALSYYTHFPSRIPDKKERIKSIRSLGQQMRKQNQIDRVEAISEIYLNQADAHFFQKGLHKQANEERLNQYIAIFQTYLKHLP